MSNSDTAVFSPTSPPIKGDLRYYSAKRVSTSHFLDTFTDTAGTDLAAHAPDDDTSGNGYTNEVGSITITAANRTNNNGAALYTFDIGLSDFTMTANLYGLNFGNPNSLFFRGSVPSAFNNAWRAQIYPGIGRAAIVERSGGSDTIRASQSGLGDKSWVAVPVTVTAAGQTITFSSSSVKVFNLSYNSATFNEAATTMGLGSIIAGGGGTDNLEINP